MTGILKVIWTFLSKRIVVYCAILAAVAGAGYAVGRLHSPKSRVETKEVIKTVVDQKAIEEAVTKAKIQWQATVKTKTKVITKYIEGKPSERIVYVDRDAASSGSSDSTTDSKKTTDTHTDTTKQTTQVTERIYQKQQLSIGVFAAKQWNTFDLSFKYGVNVDYRVWGDIWLQGIAIPQDKYIGLGLKLSM